MTGKARLVCENPVFPAASRSETEDKATVKSVYVLFDDFCTGRTTKLSWNLAVSMPPNRIEPLRESITR